MAIGKLTILLTVCWLATLLVATAGDSQRRSERSDRRVAAVRESKSQSQRGDVDAERRQERLGQLPQRVLQTRDERSLTRSSGSERLDGRRAQQSRINDVDDRRTASQTTGDRRRSLSSEEVPLTGRRDSQRRRELENGRRQEANLVRRTRSISPSTVSEDRDVQSRRRASNTRLSRSRSEDGLLTTRRQQSERRYTRKDSSSKSQLEVDARRQSPDRRREAAGRERREETDSRRSDSQSHRQVVENRNQNQERRDNRRENPERRREVNGQERRQRAVADDQRRAVMSTVAVGTTDDRRETSARRDVRNILNGRKQDLDLTENHKLISSHDQLNIFDKDYTQYAKWESCGQGLLTGLVGVALIAMKSSSKSAY